ncbi:MAG TPA: carboxypeptidase regulatory-like domain-containing protein [Pyrinomonadaceae bacterium]|jgi:hypothetical protein
MKVIPLHSAPSGGRCSLLLLLIGLFCFNTTSVSAQQEATSPARASSVVRGRIVYEDTGKPMRYARVFLSTEKSRQRERLTSTDARGEFIFRNVAAGNYLASVLPPDVFGSNSYPSAPEGGETVSVDGTSAVELKLRGARGGSISGKVTYADGEPVVSARIVLLRAVGEHWNAVGQCCTGGPVTDDRGVYRLYGLPPGEYKVGVAEEGLQVESSEGGGISSGSNQSLLTFFYPSVVGQEMATLIKVSPGRAVEGIDVALPEVRTFNVSGTVSLGGQLMRGVTLTLQMKNSQGHKIATTDADGKWVFKSVPDGTYSISTQPGSVSWNSDPEITAKLMKAVQTSRSVTVSGADVEGVTIALSEGAAIMGTVVVEGGVALPQHMELMTTRTDDALRPSGEGMGRGKVEPGGSFRIEGVKPGEVFIDLGIYPSGYHYVKSIMWNGQDLLREPLAVTGGGEIKRVRVTLATGLATLKGSVTATVAAAGQQLQQAAEPCVVVLVPADPALLRRRSFYLWAELSPENKFSMKGAPGEYLAMPLNPKFGNNLAQYIKDHAQGAQRVTLRAKEETKLELSRGCERETAK